MSIESIKQIMDNFDPATLLPELDSITGRMELVARLAVMAGPILLVVLGLLYLFLPAKEANYRYGYRCYFGMGSVEAWRFSQKVAGLAFGVLGLVLTIVMLLLCAGFRDLPVMDMVGRAAKCLIWQAGLALVICLGINITAMVFFNGKGEPRRK